MVQARWAVTLILLLVALPAQDVGAAPWRAQAVGRWAGQGQHPALTDPDEQVRHGIQLTHFVSKAPEREAAPQEEAPQEGRQAVPVPGENTRAFHTTGVSGNCCPLGIQRRLPRSPGVCRLFSAAAAAPCHSSQTVSALPATRSGSGVTVTSGVQAVAVAVPWIHTRTLCGCSKMLTTSHTPFSGISELCSFGNEATWTPLSK